MFVIVGSHGHDDNMSRSSPHPPCGHLLPKGEGYSPLSLRLIDIPPCDSRRKGGRIFASPSGRGRHRLSMAGEGFTPL